MKSFFVKVMAISGGIILCHLAIASNKELPSEKAKKIIMDNYARIIFGSDDDRSFIVNTFLSSCGVDTKDESRAYEALLPKFFERVEREAKKTDWFKALSLSDGSLREFLAYIYKINGQDAREKSGITVTDKGASKIYKLGNKELKKELNSFLRPLAKASLGQLKVAAKFGSSQRNVFNLMSSFLSDQLSKMKEKILGKQVK